MINHNIKNALEDFRINEFGPLLQEVIEKQEKAKEMYDLCIDLLSKSTLLVPAESNKTDGSAFLLGKANIDGKSYVTPQKIEFHCT